MTVVPNNRFSAEKASLSDSKRNGTAVGRRGAEGEEEEEGGSGAVLSKLIALYASSVPSMPHTTTSTAPHMVPAVRPLGSIGT